MSKRTFYVEDYIGKTYGSYTIVGFSHKSRHGEQYWLCKCQCGYEHPVRLYPLLNGLQGQCSYCRKQSYKGAESPYWKGGKILSSSKFKIMIWAAKKRKLEWDLTIEYLESIWLGFCPYTDEELYFGETTRDFGNVSLDRIDSSKGYIEGNVMWVTKEVNMAKQKMLPTEFINLCKRITKHQGGVCGV